MANKAVTIGDLIHRVATSCLSNRLPGSYAVSDSGDTDFDDDDDDDPFADAISGAGGERRRRTPSSSEEAEADDEGEDGGEGGEEEDEENLKIWEEKRKVKAAAAVAASGAERAREAETLMAEVFDAVSGVRRAYSDLQGAHCPWDPDKMRSADAAVVAKLRHLARLRDRFRRSVATGGHIPGPIPTAPPLREAVAPYEAALDDLRRQLQAKQAEVDGLKEKLAVASNRRNSRHHPSKHNASGGGGGGGAPMA